MKKRVRVSQEDIDQGIVGDGCNCPIGRAVRRAFNLPAVWVDGNDETAHVEILPNSRQNFSRVDLPTKCATFMTKFDNNKSVKPFGFDLEIPDKLL